MTRIYLVRHAEAEGNLYRIAHGHYNGLITARGYKQIAALQQRFEHIHIDAVYSSDLFRTRTTARAVYVPKGLTLHTDPNLREVNMGVWEGRTWQQLRMEDEEHGLLRVDIDEVISVKEIQYVGIEARVFLCRATVGERQWLFELKYTIRTHCWCLMRKVY